MPEPTAPEPTAPDPGVPDPGGRAPAWLRTAPERAGDVLIVLLVTVVGAVAAAGVPGIGPAPLTLAVLLTALHAAPVLLRRTRPRTALLLAAVPFVALAVLLVPSGGFALAVLAHALLRAGRPALRFLLAVLVATAALSGALLGVVGGLDAATAAGFATGLLVALLPVVGAGALLGHLSRRASVRAGAERAEREAVATARALAAERSRIADDLAAGVLTGLRRLAAEAAALHDRVPAAEQDGPAATGARLAALQDDARQVLAGMRRVLTALRTSAARTSPGTTSTGDGSAAGTSAADDEAGGAGTGVAGPAARFRWDRLPAPTSGGVAAVAAFAVAAVVLDALVRAPGAPQVGEPALDRYLPIAVVPWDRPVALLLLALQLLPLAWWRTAPLTAFAVAGAAAIGSAAHGGTNVAVELSWTVLVYAAARWAPVLASAVAVAAGTVLVWSAYTVVGFWSVFPTTSAEVLSAAVLHPVLWASGALRRTLRLRAADRARRHDADRLRDAVADERHRIARDLHDVVAHHVSAIAVQAGAARMCLPGPDTGAGDPVVLGEAVAHIAESGRLVADAVQELTRVTPDAADTVALTADGVTELARPVVRAGVPVEVHVHGDPAVPGDADLFAQRILTEALTNVVRHAGAGTTRVDVHHDPDAVRVEVRDSVAAPDRGPQRVPARVAGSGLGLVGMRERAALLGGSVHAGPEGPGWVVRARLPRRAADPSPGLLLEEEAAS